MMHNSNLALLFVNKLLKNIHQRSIFADQKNNIISFSVRFFSVVTNTQN